MIILEENHHSFLIVEHDPLLYEDAGEMVKYLAQALKQTSREATILLYAPALDPHLQKMMELADRVFCIHEEKSSGERAGEDQGENARRPENAGGVLVRWPWRQEARLIEPCAMVNSKDLELEMAKKILEEVFDAMARRGGGDDTEEGWWPATFCLASS